MTSWLVSASGLLHRDERTLAERARGEGKRKGGRRQKRQGVEGGEDTAECPHVREMVLRGPARCTIPGAALMVAEQTFITGPPSTGQEQWRRRWRRCRR